MRRFMLLVCGVFLLSQVMSVDAIAQDKQRRKGGKNRQARVDKAPKLGDEAPTFVLKSQDGESETDLASFKGDKPVVLMFGSYT